MPNGGRRPIHIYVAVVAVVGGLVLALQVATSLDTIRASFTVATVILFVFVAATELRPLRVRRGDEEGEVTTSITFAFALLLVAGTAVSVLALVSASLLADVLDRRVWWKALFNIGQYTLAMTAAGLVIALGTEAGPGGLTEFTSATLPPVLLAGVAFVLINVGLTGVAVAMAQGLPVVTFFRQDLAFQAGSATVLMSASPVVVVVAQHSLALLPLLAVPVAVGYRTAAVSLEKEHQRNHDALTGLPNRVLFYERVSHALLASRNNADADDTVILMIIDLDRFKEINDTLGHSTGDHLLCQIGPRLRSVAGERATVARLGGDEFGILLRSSSGLSEAERIARRIGEVLEEHFEVDEVRLEISASIGIALATGMEVEPDAIVRRADIAMYVAKAQHAGFAVFDPVHDRHSVERLALVAELRQAIANDELVVHFQPKLDLRSGRIAGAEALVRWNHPERGTIPPDEFIPLAERTGLIRPLTTVVLDHALRECRRWHEAGFPMTVGVNLSARVVLGGEIEADVQAALEAWNLDPRVLTLELTESVIMVDEPRVSEVLAGLDAMGVALSIDDYGTGYSSLAYLKRLPVDEIKIDKSFVLDLSEDDNDALIVRSTIDLGRNLGLRVVAEGVESATVLGWLRSMGCDVAQGYLLSRPLPQEAMLDWLRDFTGEGTGPAAAARDALASVHPIDLTGTIAGGEATPRRRRRTPPADPRAAP